MTKYILSLLAIVMGAMAAKAALAVTPSAAGSLPALIGNPAEVTDLTVTGPVNAYDLDFIDTHMPQLLRLDLSGATIEAGNGRRLRGISYHPAGRIPARIFTGSPVRELLLPDAGDITVGDGAFAGSAIESISVRANVKDMGNGAFSGCTALKTVTLAVGTVGESAFAGCTALESVTLTAPVAVADYAFADCSSLTAVDGASNITSIGRRAFANCAALAGFSFGSGLTDIGDEAFLAAGLHEADLTPCTALDSVGEWAFAHMPRLESLDLGKASWIGRGIVFDCPRLNHLNFPNEADTVPDLAYAKNTALDTTGIMHDEVTYIGDHAMHGMSQVTTFTLPASLEYIGDGAMEGMTSLQRINISATTPPATGEDVWNGLDHPKIVLQVSDAGADNYRAADQWRNFAIYSVSGIDDVLDDAAGERLRARFEGDRLVVESAGLDLICVSLYNVGGLLLDSAEAPAGRAEFDTAGSADRVYLIGAVMADGRSASLKIAKN